jgi:hypothetical protein
MDVLLIVNAVVGIISGLYVLIFALKYSNGKKPIRIVSAAILLHFGIIYSLACLNIIPIADIGPIYTRPVIWLLCAIPVWECRVESNGQGTH